MCHLDFCWDTQGSVEHVQCETSRLVCLLWKVLSIRAAPNLAERERVSGSLGTPQIQASFRAQKKGVAVFEGACTSEPKAFCTLGDWMSSLRLSGRSRMSREVHVRISEGLGVKFPRSTQPYIPTGEGWLYLAGHKDLFTGEVVGYAMSERMTKNLVSQSLLNAIAAKRPAVGLIHHSDRGSQYCAREYTLLLDRFGMRASMSRKGNCYDNATMESFWGVLKNEQVHHCCYETRVWLAFFAGFRGEPVKNWTTNNNFLETRTRLSFALFGKVCQKFFPKGMLIIMGGMLKIGICIYTMFTYR